MLNEVRRKPRIPASPIDATNSQYGTHEHDNNPAQKSALFGLRAAECDCAGAMDSQRGVDANRNETWVDER
jgi:hypothetical protein